MGTGSPTTRGTFEGQILKRDRPINNWFIIGTTSRTAARKLVKNLKYAKIGLAVGSLDLWWNFWAPSVWNSWRHSLQQNLPILNTVLANLGSPYKHHKEQSSKKCMCANLKTSYGYLSSVITLFIFFRIRHFRSRPQCASPAGRPYFSRHSFWGMVRAQYSGILRLACSRHSQPYSQSGSSDVASRYDFYIATCLFCCFSCAVYKAVLVACNLE